MNVGTPAPTPFARDVAAAATSLAEAADLLASTPPTADAYTTALRRATLTSDLLAGADGKMYPDPLRDARHAAATLTTIAFGAVATQAGAPPRFEPPAAEVLEPAVAQAHEAARALQDELPHLYE